MQEKRITWKFVKTINVHSAYNDKKEHLGWLEYERVGAFMHWCWYQNRDIRMSPGCLQEVRDKQKELLKMKNGKIKLK